MASPVTQEPGNPKEVVYIDPYETPQQMDGDILSFT